MIFIWFFVGISCIAPIFVLDWEPLIAQLQVQGLSKDFVSSTLLLWCGFSATPRGLRFFFGFFVRMAIVGLTAAAPLD